MIQIIFFSLMICLDITLTHLNMKKYRQICPDRYWIPERNFAIRFFYKKFSMPVAFTLTLVYFLPFIIILYYLFLKNELYFIVAVLIYLAIFAVHFFMARMLAKEVGYEMLLREEGIRRMDNENDLA